MDKQIHVSLYTKKISLKFAWTLTNEMESLFRIDYHSIKKNRSILRKLDCLISLFQLVSNIFFNFL